MSEIKKLISDLQKIEDKKHEIISKIKDIIKTNRGDFHDWKFFSVHHGWTFWYKCKLCKKQTNEDRNLTEENKKEKCYFFDKNFIPYINDLKEYLKY